MKEYQFTTEVVNVDANKCRLVVPLSISKDFDRDVWMIDYLTINGTEIPNKSLSRNMRKYFYILVDKKCVEGHRYADVVMRV